MSRRWRRARRQRDLRLGLRGARDALLLPAWVVAVTMIGVGALAQDTGLPLGAAMLGTLTVWAGPAQLVLFTGLAAGTGLAALALAVSLTGVRLLPMALSVLPLMERADRPLWRRLLMAHMIAVTTWAEGVRRLPALPRRDRGAYYLGFAAACMGLSVLLTGAGHAAAAVLPPVLGALVLFLSPLFFTLSLVAGVRRAADAAAIALGFALAPVFGLLVGPQADLLATGLIGGTLAWALGRWQAGRRR